MTKSTKNILRLISVLTVLALVLMDLGFIPNLFNYKFWVLVVAYALLLISLKK